MRLFVATHNPHKLDEILAIFEAGGLELLSIRDYPDLPDVDEDGDTFEANAGKKAVSHCRATGLMSLADDSGLEVEALGGAPGVYSARYAGEPVDYAANNRKLLRALEGVAERRARFRCVVALAEPDGVCHFVEGRCYGQIAVAPRGPGGFGYDPVFVPDGHDRTFAEMEPWFKNRISHRARALRAARAAWAERLTGGRASAGDAGLTP